MLEPQGLRYSLRSIHNLFWRDPSTGGTYTVTPLRTYPAPEGRYCREYQMDAIIGSRRQQVYGTACRQPDGSWQMR